jgi:hypothetical protein
VRPPTPLRRSVGRVALEPGTVVPLVIALAFLVLLAASAGTDPARGVTASTSPFTDEGWNVVNARNLVLFGRWSTDDWNMYLVNLPFSLLEAAWLAVAGVGIVQARLLVIASGAVALATLGIGLRRPLGAPGAALATAALAGSALLLYYGRLAYLEPLVTLWLIAALVALGGERPSVGTGAVAGLALGLAIATKASAGFAAAGMLGGVALLGWRQTGMRRALAGAVLGLLVVALAWTAIFALPNPAALATDLRIWAPEPLPHSLAELFRRITSYPGRSDGGIPLALPLLAAGGAGLLTILAGWRSLDGQQRRVVGACAGWFAIGMGVLLAVPYRPNRYLVPLLPPLAVLAGLGFAVLVRWAGGRRAITAGLGLALSAVLIAPGLALQVGWATSMPSTLPSVQARIAALVPAGSAVQGDLAPVLAMQARARTIVSRPATRVNPGDLYRTQGVRWVLTAGPAPEWAPLHAAAWAARVKELCVDWGPPGPTCLYRLP